MVHLIWEHIPLVRRTVTLFHNEKTKADLTSQITRLVINLFTRRALRRKKSCNSTHALNHAGSCIRTYSCINSLQGPSELICRCPSVVSRGVDRTIWSVVLVAPNSLIYLNSRIKFNCFFFKFLMSKTRLKLA